MIILILKKIDQVLEKADYGPNSKSEILNFKKTDQVLEKLDSGSGSNSETSNFKKTDQISEKSDSGSSSKFEKDSHPNQMKETVSFEKFLDKSLEQQQKHVVTGTGNREKGLKNSFGLVYEKKLPDQRKEVKKTLPGHKSNPSQVQDVSGNSHLIPERGSQSNSKSKNLPFSDLDVPIAVEKGNRLCICHPMSNFVSYKNLSPSFSAFTSQFSCVEIPQNV